MQERDYWLGFSYFQGIGPTRLQILLQKFWTAENAWNASFLELRHTGLGEKLSAEFIDFRKKFDLNRYKNELQEKNIGFITQEEATYPQSLLTIQNPPLILYTKGESTFPQGTYIAVVGTRKITEYGRQITQSLVEDLSAAGCIIVSGLAMGVDAVAHKATVTASGKTIAVLGCGVDCCYPQENYAIYQQILEKNGMIISEYPPGMPPSKGSFPSRNRIIAGLSKGVLVTEGATDSGSLITAQIALENNRIVFAVPGPITSSVSNGPNTLIASGAVMVTSAADMLTMLKMSQRASQHSIIKGDSPEEQMIIDLLENENFHFDELVKRTGFMSSELGTLLSLMEVKGKIRSLDAGMYSIGA